MYPKTGFFETSVLMLKRKMTSLPKRGKNNSLLFAIRPSINTVVIRGPVGCYVKVNLKSMALMGERRGVYRVLVGKPGGKRLHATPRIRWEYNIKLLAPELFFFLNLSTPCI